MTGRHLADRVLPPLVVLVAALAVVHTAARLPYFSYDEGVYFHQAAEWARGRTPYTDFFVPQPPGILCVGWASEKVGVGIGGVRAFTALCGLVLLYQTYRLGRRVSDPVGWAAAGFLASSAEWTYTALEAATQTPATVLILLAVELVLAKRLGWAGVVIGLATLFRVQAMTLLPGLGLAVFVRDGFFRSRKRERRTTEEPSLTLPARTGPSLTLPAPNGLVKLASAVVVAAAIHGLLSATVPGYWEGVFQFQFDRPRMVWESRAEVLTETFGQPAAVFGLLAAAGFVLKDGGMRPLGIIGLVTAVVTAFAGNSLFRPYFVAVLPLLAVCGATAVNELLARFRHPPRAWAVVAVLTAACGIGAIRLHAELDRNREPHRQFLDAIRATPADVWLTTDGRLLELTGKRMAGDYFATDPGGLFVRDPTRFQSWFRERLVTADAVAVTDLLTMIADEDTARAVFASGKPVVFESDDGRRTFSRLAGK